MKRNILRTVTVGFLLAASLSGNAYAAGWVKNDTGWWYDNGNNTYPASSWMLIGGQWYHFDENGYMDTGFVYDQGTTYYCYESGAMAVGWVWIDEWYHFGENGAMDRGRWIGDYYVKADGRMARSQEVDGYWVDENGKWVPGKKSNKTEKAKEEVKEKATEEVKKEETKKETKEEKSVSETSSDPVQDVVQNPDSTLSISGHTELKGKYDVGTSLSLNGVIQSNYNIETVTVNLRVNYMGVYDYTRTYPVNGKQINLEDLDLSYFDTTRFTGSAASYCFTVTAKDASGTERELVRDYFNMKYMNRVQITFEDSEKIQTTMEEGTNFEVNGIARSNYPISDVIVTVYSAWDNSVVARGWAEPFTLEYDLANLQEYFDFEALEPGNYRYTISISVGSHSKTPVNERFTVTETASSDIVMYSINARFEDSEDGTLITNGFRPFDERILSDASGRIKRKYSNAHPCVEFKWEKNPSDIRGNHVYAHSDGKVTAVNKTEGIVEINCRNGYTIKYSGMTELHVREGVRVDENTTVGEIPENGSIAVYLYNDKGESLNIADYLDKDF